MRVNQWMTPHPLTTTPETGARAALDEMRKKKVRRLPVLENDKLIGIITQSDLFTALGSAPGARTDAKTETATVADCMTRSPATIAPDASLDDAAAVMYRLRVSGLPVVAGNELVGIITETDMFRALVIVLGFTESGVIMEFELERADHLLTQIRQRTADMIVRNLIVFQDPRSGKIGVRMKVRGREAAPTKRIAAPKKSQPSSGE